MVVSETWYLDPIEWRRFREELRQARAAYERMSQLVQEQYDMRQRRFKRNSAVRMAPYSIQKLMLKTTDIDRYFEDIAKVAPCIEFDLAYQEWKSQRNQFFREADTIRRLFDVTRTKQVIRDKKFVRLQRVKAEAQKFQKLMLRLEQREKILMQAIQAGLFLTKGEVADLETMSGSEFRAMVKGILREVA